MTHSIVPFALSRLTVITVISLVVTAAAPVAAQDETASDASSPVDIAIASKLRIEATFFGGTGLEDHVVGEAVNNDDPSERRDLTISGGGGVGGRLSVALGLTDAFEVSIDGGAQESALSTDVENADGTFTRSFVRTAVGYRFPISPKGIVRIVAGAGYYIPGQLDLDFSGVADGGHNKFDYDSAMGFHLGGAYEHFFKASENAPLAWSAVVGGQFYGVTYDLDSADLDGVSMQLEDLPPELRSEVKELDGGGFDLTVGIVMHVL